MESHSIARLNVFENIPYICSYCNYLFEDPKDYKEHVSYHIKVCCYEIITDTLVLLCLFFP